MLMQNNTIEIAQLLGEGKQIHKEIIKAVEKVISDKELFKQIDTNTVKAIECNAIFTKSTYKTSRNNVYNMYKMNEAGVMLLSMQLSKYHLGRLLQHDLVTRLQQSEQKIRAIKDYQANTITV